ncbi:MAG: IPT/TIG domain-containing protein [Sandaracinaceae bacterium]|nr:IPT/TIG domain-containing protein [Sandaracinaceae bacterium]
MLDRSLRLALLGLVALAALAALPSASRAQIQQPPPVIERLEPTAGPVGTTVQVLGRFFRADQRLFLGNVELPVGSRLPSRWSVTIPAGAQTGRLEVRLADGTTVTGPELRVLASVPTPSIAGFTPLAGAAGSEVRIQGENFSPRLTDNTVMLNGTTLVVRTATPTELTVIVPAGASSGPFVVRVAGAGEATSTTTFTVGSGTQITSFTPRVASPGAQITLTGTGFVPLAPRARTSANRVFLENVALRVVSATATEIVVELPANAASGRLLVDVRGGGRAYATETLSVLPAPTITALEPASGVVGAQFRVRGTNFGSDIRQVTASIGATALTLRAVAPTELTVQVPAGATSGPVSVVVSGLPAVTSATPFQVLLPVAVSGLEPISGPVGTEVTIRGQGFSTTLTDDHVTLQNVECPVLAATPTELRVRIPQTGSGPLVVTVTNAGTGRTTQPFVITTPPFITRFEPAAATIGSTVRLFGTSFGTNPATVEVALAGRRMEIRAITDTQLDAVVPPGATSGRITVTVRLQGTGAAATDFTVLTDFAVSAIEPASAYPGQTVAIRGGGFLQEGMTVSFTGARSPATYTFVNGSELRAVVPADAASGPITVRLPDGRSLASSAFTRTEAPSGVGITEVVPACLRPGCTLVVRGYGFGTRPGGQTVTIYGQRLRVRRASAYELELTLPRQAGTGPVIVTVRGQPAAQSAQPLTIAP